MQVGFTGTQQGLTPEQLETLENEIRWKKDPTLHHGDCIGADEECHDLARQWGYTIEVHPPADPSKRAFKVGDVNYKPKPYIERNHDIVDAANMLIACPGTMQEIVRSGTWATVRYARKTFVPVLIVWPNGTVSG